MPALRILAVYALMGGSFMIPAAYAGGSSPAPAATITQADSLDAARFIPATSPEGFAPADSIRLYGTGPAPLRDGTIYDYIDGGGMVYVSHGFRAVTHAAYATPEGAYLTLDIYDMGTPLNTRALMADETVCPPGYTPLPLGTGGKRYDYSPDLLIHFIKGRYFVSLILSDDRLADAALAFATAVADLIE